MMSPEERFTLERQLSQMTWHGRALLYQQVVAAIHKVSLAHSELAEIKTTLEILGVSRPDDETAE